MNTLCMEYRSGSEILDFRPINDLGKKKDTDSLDLLTSWQNKKAATSPCDP